VRALIPLLLLAACQAAPGPAELLDAQVETWNAGDLDGFVATGYWRSPELTFYSGDEVRLGYDGLLERYRASYGAPGAEMGRLSFEEVEVLRLDPVNALARGRWALEYADGSRRGGLFTLLLHRTPAGWRIVHDHTSSAPAAAG
jgi:hypothetical protein